VLARCDWLSCNHREAALLTSTGLSGRGLTSTGLSGTGAADAPGGTGTADAPGDPAELARRLLARGAAANIIVRAGAAGCYVARYGSSGAVHVRSRKVTAVDTTGAGDAHSGAFLAALAEDLPPLDAAAWANAAAAFAVTRPGPATSPTRTELDAWLRG
jgi:sugar/nucleoside kinase (ribokinase family)